MGAFGEKLRRQREQRGIALDAISNTTKISTRMLRALEDEHFDQLPGGVFNKGFVRAYARQVGLDEEEALADYLIALRESQIQQQAILPDFRSPAKVGPAAQPDLREDEVRQDGLRTHDHAGDVSPVHDHTEQIFSDQGLPDHARGNDGDNGSHDFRGEEVRPKNSGKQDRRRTDRRHPSQPDSAASPESATQTVTDKHPALRPPKYPAGSPDQPTVPIPWGKLGLALLLVVLALVLWNFRRHRQVTAAGQPAGTQISSGIAPATPAAAISTHSSSVTSALTSAPGHLFTAKPPTESPSTTAASKTASTPSAASSSTSASANGNVNPAVAGSPSSTKKPVAVAAAKPLPTFTLKIRAEKTTWVAITADGKPIAQETLIAPANTSVRATHEIVVKAGNAAGVSFQLNGKDVAVEGNEAEVKTYVFDASGVRVSPQASPATTVR